MDLLVLFTGDVLRECTSCRPLLAARLGDVCHSSLETDVVGEISFALPFLVDEEEGVTEGEAGLFVDLLALLFELVDELPFVDVLRVESFWPSSCLDADDDCVLDGGGLEANLDELEWEPE